MHHFLPLQAADLNRITLASWDWMVIGLFFLAMVWICWSVSRKKKETSGDYFLSGRSATWIAIGASIFASNIGSEHLIGLAGTGASAGMAQAHWEIPGPLGNPGLDDPYPRLGLRAVLRAQYGVHHA